MYAHTHKKNQFKLEFRVKRKEFVPKDIKYTWISQLYAIHAPRLYTLNHSNETIWSWNFSESGEKINMATSPFVCLPCSEIYLVGSQVLNPALEVLFTWWFPFLLLLLLLLLLSRFSRVWLCATPQTAAHQAPPSLGFSRQEHWSGVSNTC